MAYDRCVHQFTLDFRRPTINRLQMVDGDTANTFEITLKDRGKAVTLDADLHKVVAVFTRADGQIYTQDAGTGVTFTTGGVVTIDVYSSSFRTGVNNVKIQLYKRANAGDTTYPLLLTTYEQQFQGRSQAIPDSGAPNAPSQLPMLEGLIEDARDAISDCEDATDAANNAAGEANDAAYDARVVTAQMTHMLNNIDDEPTQSSNHLVKSGGVYSFVTDKIQEAADDVRAQIPAGATANPLMDGTAAKGSSTKWAREDHVHPRDTTKQDKLTFDDAPTAGSNNPVKSGGIKTAIDNAAASAAKKNVYFVKHAAASWQTSGSRLVYVASLVDSAATLTAIAADAVFVAQVPSPDGSYDITLYEVQREDGIIYLRSEIIEHAYTINAAIDISTATLDCARVVDESPLLLYITGTEEVQGTGGQTYRKVTFASGETDEIYAGRDVREMIVDLPDWTPGSIAKHTLRKIEALTNGTLTQVRFSTGLQPTKPGDPTQSKTVGTIESYEVNVFYNDGVFHSAVATHFTGTL